MDECHKRRQDGAKDECEEPQELQLGGISAVSKHCKQAL